MHSAGFERRARDDPVRVLLVGDRTVTTATGLEADLDDASVVAESTVTDALDRLAVEAAVDCVVVEHDPPATDGVERLRALRAATSALPLVLAARAVDEALVTAAVDAGATDVVAADPDASATLLARRVGHALETAALRRDVDRLRSQTADAVCRLDEHLTVTAANDRLAATLDREGESLVGETLPGSFETADGASLAAVCRSVLSSGEAAAVEARDDEADRWVAVRILPAGAGLLALFTDETPRRRAERIVDALETAAAGFVAAATPVEVADRAATAVATCLPAARAVVYLFDAETNRLRAAASDGETQSGPDDGSPIGPDDGSPIWAAFAAGDDLAVDDSAPSGSRLLASLGPSGCLVVEPAAEGALDERAVRLVRLLADGATASLERRRFEAMLDERERELVAQRRRLDRLDRATRTLLDVESAVAHAKTRGDLVRAVCAELGRADRFGLVWIGRVDEERNRVVPEEWAGVDRGYLDDVDLSLDGDDPEPSVRAMRERRPVHVANVAHGRRRTPWRRELLNRGHRSVLSLPLVHGGTLHGVVTVCASVTDAFDAASERIFRGIADATAHGIDAVERKRALVTDSVIELEVRLRDPTDHVHRLARHVDGTVTFEGAVAGSPSTLYLSVADAAPEEVLTALSESVSVRDADHLGGRDGGDLYVATVAERTIVSWAAGAGAAVTELTATPSETRLVVELPRSGDVRQFRDDLEGAYPDAEVLAQRTHERPIESRRTFLATLEERLTDRQLEVLQTAYLEGYFEWPRLRTGEELADRLGITQPTFNNHLRVAERKLFATLFGETEST